MALAELVTLKNDLKEVKEDVCISIEDSNMKLRVQLEQTNRQLKYINDSMDSIAESLNTIAMQQKFHHEKNEYTSTEDLGYISHSLDQLVKHFTKQ